MASLSLACSASLRPVRLATAAAPRRLQVAAACRRTPPLTVAAAAAPPPAQAATRQATRQAARQQRLEQAAGEAARELMGYATTRAAQDARFRNWPGSARVQEVAMVLLLAGMSRTGAVRLLMARPGLLASDTQLLAAYAAIVQGVMRGVTSKRITLANQLGSAAASAALAQRPLASFAASCELVSELTAAAYSCYSLAPPLGQLDVLLNSGRDAAELRAVFAALQQHLGWSAQQAGAALLGLELQAGPSPRPHLGSETASPRQLHRTTVQHIEQIGSMLRQHDLQGNLLAHATFAARADWAATTPADAAPFIAALEDAGLPPYLAAMVWLAAGTSAADPDFVSMWAQLTHAGAPADQLEGLARALLLPNANPACFASGAKLLHELLGSWTAVTEAVGTDPLLLTLTASLLAEREAARAPSPAGDIAALSEQLRALATGQEQLLRLIKCVLPLGGSGTSLTQALGSLQLLATLLDSPEAALEAAEGDHSLLRLPFFRYDWQVVCARLSAAGLTDEQLVQMASIIVRYPTQVDRLIWLAEELYAGDWNAAMVEFLRRWKVYVRCLCWLRCVLDALAVAGLEVANEAGRERVLECIKEHAHAVKAKIQLVVRQPASSRPLAHHTAALEQQGFRATGSKLLALIQRLAPGEELAIEVAVGKISITTPIDLFECDHSFNWIYLGPRTDTPT